MFYTYSYPNPKKQKTNISLIQSKSIIHPINNPIIRNNSMIDRIEKQKQKQTRCLSCH